MIFPTHDLMNIHNVLFNLIRHLHVYIIIPLHTTLVMPIKYLQFMPVFNIYLCISHKLLSYIHLLDVYISSIF